MRKAPISFPDNASRAVSPANKNGARCMCTGPRFVLSAKAYLASLAVFATVRPAELTSLPAPSTVLHADTTRALATIANPTNLRMIFLLDGLDATDRSNVRAAFSFRRRNQTNAAT